MNIALSVWLLFGAVGAVIVYVMLKDHQIAEPLPFDTSNKWHLIMAIGFTFILGPVPFIVGITEAFRTISKENKQTQNIKNKIRTLAKCPSCGTNFIGRIIDIYARQISEEQYIWCETCVPDMVRDSLDVIIEKAPQ